MLVSQINPKSPENASAYSPEALLVYTLLASAGYSMDYQSSDTRLGDSAVCMVYPEQALEHSGQLFTKPLRYQQISLALAPY